MMNPRSYDWFLEPGPGSISTNEYLAGALSNDADMQIIADNNRVDHHLWPCSYEFIKNILCELPAHPELKFTIFKRSHLDKKLTRHLWEQLISNSRNLADKELLKSLRALKTVESK